MDTLNLIIESVDKILVDHCSKGVLDAAEAGTFAGPLWEVLRENGLTDLGAADSGTSLADGYRVVQATARHAMPLPLGEHILASALLTEGGEPEDDYSVGLATVGLATADRPTVVPWARDADSIVLVAPPVTREAAPPVTGEDEGCQIRLYAASDCVIEPGANMAGEPRDRVRPGSSPIRTISSAVSADSVRQHLALLRTLQISGCLSRTLELALEYAQERVQFGRPISKFQAIQHQLAVLAGETAAASMAADGALAHVGVGLGAEVGAQIATDQFPIAVAAAKARVGEAAGVAAEIAHQVHGAMGFTHEHQLHHFTKRLWAWRDEYGNEAFWQRRLGRAVASVGADQVWDFVTQH